MVQSIPVVPLCLQGCLPSSVHKSKNRHCWLHCLNLVTRCYFAFCHDHQRCHGDVLIELWRHRADVQPDTHPFACSSDPTPPVSGGLSGPQVNAPGVGRGQRRDKAEVTVAATARSCSFSFAYVPKKDTFEPASLRLSFLPGSAQRDEVVKLGLDLQWHCPFLQWRFVLRPTCQHATWPFSRRLGCTPRPLLKFKKNRKASGSARRNIIEYGLDPPSFCGQAS